MAHKIQAPLAVALALFALPANTSATEYAKVKGLRQSASTQPIKECIRFNGRHGYYGNPWCTPAEQDRWDRWEVARLKAR
jgi:hypothetical protein